MEKGVGMEYGFAVVSSDTGYSSMVFDASWAYNALEKVANWGYRALHGSIVLAKDVIKVYYGKAPTYSYYSGCSTGGRQGLKEAEMFPEDFDGIVAGAPAWWTTHLQLWNMKVGLYNLPTTAPYHIPSSLFSVIGGEEPSSLGTDYVKYMLGLGTNWDWNNFEPSLVALSDKINPGNATANNFDLSPYYKKGGKLLHYHGYADGSIATGSSIYFYNHVLRTLKPQGIELDSFYRYFLVPGMQ